MTLNQNTLLAIYVDEVQRKFKLEENEQNRRYRSQRSKKYQK